MKLVLFDIDGTLLRCGDSPRRAFDRAFFSHFSVKLAWGPTSAHGRTDPDIIQEIAHRQLKRPLTPVEYEQLCKLYIANLEKELPQDAVYRVLPGVPKLLGLLVKQGDLLLGIQTGNMEEAAWLKLQRGGLEGYFTFGGFGSDHAERSKFIQQAIVRAVEINADRSISQLTVIGDAPQDIEAGQAVGAVTISVATGKTSKEQLADCRPDYLLDDLSDIEQLSKILF